MISNERLEELLIEDDLHNFPPSREEVNGMAKELLALRKAFSEPVAWVDTGTSWYEKGQKIINYFPSDLNDLAVGEKLYRKPPTE